MPMNFSTPRRFAPLPVILRMITLPLMVLALGACSDVQRQSASVTFASSVSASPISASPAAANPVSARPVSARGNAPGSAQPSGTGKKLMEYGWDMPTASFLQEHQARLGSSPFDGLTLKLSAGQEVFRRTRFSASAVRQDIAALRAIRSPKLRDSYLSLLSGSGPGWDWFSDADWAVTQENVRLMAGAARAGGLRGITFDMEPYTLNPWDYASQPGAASHTFAAAQARVRERGAAFIRTAQTAFPGIQIYALYLLTANSSDVGTDNSQLQSGQLQSKQLQSNLQGSDSGLWPSFVNGMLEAAAPGTTLVEGNEHAYDYLRAEQFSAARTGVQRTLLPLVAPENRSRYQQVQLGQAIFADGVMNLWKSPRFCGYYFRSDADRAQVLQHNVYQAMRTADETAWFYNENMDWWGSSAGGQHVPASIVSAVREGRRRAQAGEPLGQNLSAFVPAAEAACNAKVTIGGDLLSGQPSENTRFEVNGVLQGLNDTLDPNCGTWNGGRRYGCTFPGGWSGTLRPVAAGVKFDPPIRTYQNQMEDDWAAHFVAKP